jgi:hypothetical protein
MLVLKLCELPCSEYTPKHEIISREKKIKRGREEGIWDILGQYDCRHEIVWIYEKEIARHAEGLSKKLGIEIVTVYSILRELVRLHEHAHAYTHTANLSEGPLIIEREWFLKLPEEILEPLAEFISYIVIKHVESDVALKIFEEADRNTPTYYQRWVQLKDLKVYKDDKEFSLAATYYSIPLLVKIARKKVWSNWEEFLEELKSEEFRDKLASEVLKHYLF